MENTEKLDFVQIWQLIQETDKIVKELAISSKETDKKIQELTVNSKETDKQITKLGKQIGGLGNSFGRYTEGILGPSIRKILENKFGAEYVTANVERKLNGVNYEIDFFGACNGTQNKAFVVEVKTTLQDKHIDQLLKIVNILTELMPEQKGKQVFGAIAAVSFTKEQKAKVLKNGFYFLNIIDELARLDVPKDFQPKVF